MQSAGGALTKRRVIGDIDAEDGTGWPRTRGTKYDAPAGLCGSGTQTLRQSRSTHSSVGVVRSANTSAALRASFMCRNRIDGLPTRPPCGHRRLGAPINADWSAERSNDRSPPQPTITPSTTCLVDPRRILARISNAGTMSRVVTATLRDGTLEAWRGTMVMNAGSASRTHRPFGWIRFLGLAAAVLVFGEVAGADTVAVHGRASTFLEPDRIRVELGVERKAPTPREAYESLNTGVRAVYRALAAAGIDLEASVRTQRLQLWSGDRGREHHASSVVHVERRIDSAHPHSVTRFLGAAFDAGASSIQGLSFDTDPRRVEETTIRLMKEAVQAARVRAESLATAESRTIGRLVRATESGVSHRPPVAMLELKGAFAPRVSADEGIPVHSGAGVVVTVMVEAVFELE